MGEGVVFVLVAAVWFVFRKRIAAYQVYLITDTRRRRFETHGFG